MLLLCFVGPVQYQWIRTLAKHLISTILKKSTRPNYIHSHSAKLYLINTNHLCRGDVWLVNNVRFTEYIQVLINFLPINKLLISQQSWCDKYCWVFAKLCERKNSCGHAVYPQKLNGKKQEAAGL